MLIIFAGLPGSGKSTLARVLAERVNGVVLDKDVVRHEMFGPDGITFTTEQDDLVVDEMLQGAAKILREDSTANVLLDGRVFSRNLQLKHVIDFAESISASWVVIECVCSESTAKKRITSDVGKHIAANRTPELYYRVRARFEPIPEPKLVIDTDHSLESSVERVLLYIQSK